MLWDTLKKQFSCLALECDFVKDEKKSRFFNFAKKQVFLRVSCSRLIKVSDANMKPLSFGLIFLRIVVKKCVIMSQNNFTYLIVTSLKKQLFIFKNKIYPLLAI